MKVSIKYLGISVPGINSTKASCQTIVGLIDVIVELDHTEL